MLSSIHPLGERTRDNRWWVTVTAFTLGSTVTGALAGVGLGFAGATLLAAVGTSTRFAVTAGAALVAGLLDVFGVRPWGSTRQVNEHWIGHYRGWVYGGGFGIQLGAGIVTYVVTWGVYATFVGEFLTASPRSGAIVGAMFGFGRSIAPLLAGYIDRSSRLTSFHERMANLGPAFRRSAAGATTALGAVAILGLML